MDLGDLLFVVLAGNDSDPAILGGIGQPSKFYLPFGDELVGERIVRALDSSGRCRAIFVAAPPRSTGDAVFDARHPLHMVAPGRTRIMSLMSGVDGAESEGYYASGEYVLVVTGDLPLLTAASIDHFIAACERQLEADCYMGMVPYSAVDDEMRPLLQREGLTFRGQPCLHTDVYLVRPSSMSETAQRRFDSIMAVRRTGRTTFRGMLRAAATAMEIVGLRGLIPFAKIVTALPNVDAGRTDGLAPIPDRLETSVLELIEEGFGLRLRLVPIDEPVLGLGFDYLDDLHLLLEYDEAQPEQPAPRPLRGEPAPRSNLPGD